jgi:hypothetical protein
VEQQVINILFEKLLEAEAAKGAATSYDWLRYHQGQYDAIGQTLKELAKIQNLNGLIVSGLEHLKIKFGDRKAKEILEA